jgi:hypothetical protein
MLQQCSSANSCMRTRIVMEKHCTGCQHSAPIFWMTLSSFFVSQCTSHVTVVPCCIKSTISTPFLSQKSVATSFLSGRQRLFKLFLLVWWMCVHRLFWLLFGLNIHKWNPGFVQCDWEIHCRLCCVALKISKPKLVSAFLAHPSVISEAILHKTCDSLI